MMSNVDRRVENLVSLTKSTKDIINIQDKHFQNDYKWANNFLFQTTVIYDEILRFGHIRYVKRLQLIYRWLKAQNDASGALANMDLAEFSEACFRFLGIMLMSNVNSVPLTTVFETLMGIFSSLRSDSNAYAKVKLTQQIDRNSTLATKNLALVEEFESSLSDSQKAEIARRAQIGEEGEEGEE